ncbi:MAG: tetratricopeptide repeat protein, partial [Chitinophagales bacterium]
MMIRSHRFTSFAIVFIFSQLSLFSQQILDEKIKYEQLGIIRNKYELMFPQRIDSVLVVNDLIEECNKLIAMDTGYYKSYALYYRARANYFLHDKIKCRADYEEAIKAYPYLLNNYEGINVLDEQKYGLEGFCEQRTKNWRLAEKNFQRATELYPEFGYVYYALGKSKYNIGFICNDTVMKNEALLQFRKAIKINPMDGQSYFELAYNHPNIDSSIYYFEKDLEALGESTYIRGHLAVKLMNQKRDYAKAEEVLLKGVELNPEYLQYYIFLETLYKNMHRKDEAKKMRETYNK